MRRSLSFTPAVFCIVFLFYPFCTFLGEGIHYRFFLYHDLLVFGIFTVLFSGATVGLLKWKVPLKGINRVLTPFLLPASFFSGIVFFFRAGEASKWVMLAFMVVSCICAAIIFIKCTNRYAAKIAAGLLTILAFFLFIWLFLVDSILGDFSSETVLQTFNSPDRSYIAEVIRSDQGALGGNTLVTVKRADAEISILIGEFTEKPKRIYCGEYGEYESILVAWENDKTLEINGVLYDIE